MAMHVIAQKLPAEKRKPWISNPRILQDSDKQIVKKEKTRNPVYKTEQAMRLNDLNIPLIPSPRRRNQ